MERRRASSNCPNSSTATERTIHRTSLLFDLWLFLIAGVAFEGSSAASPLSAFHQPLTSLRSSPTSKYSSVTPMGPRFVTELPSEKIFTNDSGAQLRCDVVGDPPLKVDWLLSRAEVPWMTDVPMLRESNPDGTLVFPPFPAKRFRPDVHSAAYRCVASNNFGRIVSKDVYVRAVVVQPYPVTVQSVRTVRHGVASLTCSVPENVKEYVSITAWIKDDAVIMSEGVQADQRHIVLPGGDLLVVNVTESDQRHTYRCRTMNRLTGSVHDSDELARIDVYEPARNFRARIPAKSHIIRVPQEAADVILPCLGEGWPPPTYRWVFLGHRGTSSQHSRPAEGEPVPGGNKPFLSLKKHLISDGDVYECVIGNSAPAGEVGGSRDAATYELRVDHPFKININPEIAVAEINSAAAFHCSVHSTYDEGLHHVPMGVAEVTSASQLGTSTGNYQPASVKYEWYKDGRPLGHGFRVSITNDGRAIRIHPVRPEDAGVYQCFVEKEGHVATGQAELHLGDQKPRITYKFIEHTLQPGPPVSLRCRASGSPVPHISWFLDGFPLQQDPQRVTVGDNVTSNNDVVSHVNISSAQPQDGGLYECVARNRAGVDRHSAKVKIYGTPQARPMPPLLTAVSGEEFTLRCPVGGHPIHSVVWFKDNEPLGNDGRRSVSPTGVLSIKATEKNMDSGVYSCKAQDKLGNVATALTTIRVVVAPIVHPFKAPELVQAGDTVALLCSVKGDLPLNVTWEKDGRALFNPTSGASSPGVGSSSSSFPASATSSASSVPSASVTEMIVGSDITIQHAAPTVSLLTIQLAGLEHTGNYTCRASNDAAEATYSQYLFVRVPPTWLVEPENVTVIRGHSTSIHCQAAGHPKPTVKWKKLTDVSGASYENIVSEQTRRISKNGTLFFPSAQKSHAGVYLCEVNNAVGTGLSKAVSLSVNVPVYFTEVSMEKWIKNGTDVALHCSAQGDPPINIGWERNALSVSKILPQNRFDIRANPLPGGYAEDLNLRATSSDDDGTWVCHATNPYGTAEKKFFLRVKNPPRPPKNVRIKSVESRLVELAWEPDSGHHEDAEQFLIEYSTRPFSQGENDAYARPRPYGSEVLAGSRGGKLIDVRPGTEYSARVRSRNLMGLSDPSPIIFFRTEEERPTAAPSDVTGTALYSRGITVTWGPVPEADRNGLVLAYNIGFRRYGEERTEYEWLATAAELSGAEASNGPRRSTMDGLAPFTQYQVVVRAVTAKGPGPHSAPVAVETPEDKPTGPPLKIECRASSSTKIDVTWDAPAAEDRNGIITHYIVHREWEEGDRINRETAKNQMKSMTFDNLIPFTGHSIAIAAANARGHGPFSDSVICSTLPSDPEPPEQLKVTKATPESVYVSWLPPRQPNGLISGYRLYRRSLDNSRGRPLPVIHRNLPALNGDLTTVETGLNSGTRYEFWVTALSEAGESAPSPKFIEVPGPAGRVASADLPRNHTVSKGAFVKLSCNFAGDPKPMVTWAFGGRTFVNTPSNGDPHFAVNEGKLTLQNAQLEHTGRFDCQADNGDSRGFRTIWLTVQDAPHTPTLSETGKNSDYVDIAWAQEPADGGKPIQNFLVSWRSESDENRWMTKMLQSSERTFRTQKLVCGENYRVTVKSKNAIGWSQASAELRVHARGSGRRRDQQVPVHAETETIFLGLEEFRLGECEITKFLIDFKKSDSLHWIQAPGAIPPYGNYVLPALQRGTLYDLRVIPVLLNDHRLKPSFFSARTKLHPNETVNQPGSTQESELTIAESESKSGARSSISKALSLRLVIPITASSIAVFVTVAAVVLCLRKRSQPMYIGHHDFDKDRQRPVPATNVIPLQNTNFHHLSGVLAGTKAMPHGVTGGEFFSIGNGDCGEEISPYASFPVVPCSGERYLDSNTLKVSCRAAQQDQIRNSGLNPCYHSPDAHSALASGCSIYGETQRRMRQSVNYARTSDDSDACSRESLKSSGYRTLDYEYRRPESRPRPRKKNQNRTQRQHWDTTDCQGEPPYDWEGSRPTQWTRVSVDDATYGTATRKGPYKPGAIIAV